MTARFERVNDAGNFKTRLDVEHAQVVRGHALAARSLAFIAQCQVGVFQLPLDQRFHKRNSGPHAAHCVWLAAPRGGAAPAVWRSRSHSPCWYGNSPCALLNVSGCFQSFFKGTGELGKAHRRADLRWRQPLACRQFGHKRIADLNTFKRFAHDAFTGAGRRRAQLQVVGKAAAKGRVNLLNAVGDPQRRHEVGFQNLVDPGLAINRTAGRRRQLVRPRHQLRSFA